MPHAGQRCGISAYFTEASPEGPAPMTATRRTGFVSAMIEFSGDEGLLKKRGGAKRSRHSGAVPELIGSRIEADHYEH